MRSGFGLQDLTTENRIASAIALVMLTYSGSACALEIGALQLKSHLGEAFRATISINASPDEAVTSSCVSLGQSATDGNLYQLKNARIEVKSLGGRQFIMISTSQSISEPILTLNLHVHCSTQGEIGKAFTVFLDPATLSPPSTPEIQAASVPPMPKKMVPATIAESTKPSGNTIRIKPHDTLSGIAYDLFPHDKMARRHFIASVLRENPGLIPDLLQVGSVLHIPDIKAMGRTPPTTEAPHPHEPRASAKRTESAVPPQAGAKPAFHLDIVSGESTRGAAQDIRNTETQLISRTDDQTVQLRQLKEQVKSLEAKLAELQMRVMTANKLLSRIDAMKLQPREEEKPVPKYVWISALLLLLGAAGGVYWYFRRKKKAEEDTLMDQYLNTTLSKPALIDHLDYFESDTPDHHKW